MNIIIALAYLGIEIFQDNEILLHVIIARPPCVIASWNVYNLAIFAAIQAHNALTPHKVGHVMKHLE